MGVSAVSEEELEAHMRSRPRPWWRFWRPHPPLDQERLSEDMDRLEKLYRQRGYYSASARYALEWMGERRSALAMIQVQEGRPVRVGERIIDLQPPEGLGEAERASLSSVLHDLPGGLGEVFDLRRYGEAKRILLERLAERGFPAAEIRGAGEVDLEARRARIDWRVPTGPLVRVGAVEITGRRRIAPEVVRRELTFAPGEVLRRSALEKSQKKLVELGLFRSVVIQPVAVPAHGRAQVTWPVRVRAVELPPRTLAAGVGYGTDDKLRGRVQWERRIWGGKMRRLEVEGRASSLRQGVEGRLFTPRALGDHTSLELRASAVRETLQAYTSDSLGTAAILARPLAGGWLGRAGYHLERSRISDVSDSAERALEPPPPAFLLSYVAAGLERSRVDDRVEPRRGVQLDLEAELSLGVLGSEFDYALGRVELRRFWPVGAAVLAARAQLAVIAPFGRTRADEVPLVKRLFSGGGSSVRGYEYQRLGPLDAQGDPLGGTTLFETSVELRFPIWKQLSGVVFLDAGQVALDPLRLKFSELQYAAGPGLRFRTPVGPARIDWGIALNPPDGFSRTRLHLSVGHAF
jgi:outer membrane protein insertion porin family/translocation and assembly module TamA